MTGWGLTGEQATTESTIEEARRVNSAVASSPVNPHAISSSHRKLSGITHQTCPYISRKHNFSTKDTIPPITKPNAALIMAIIASKGCWFCYMCKRSFRVNILCAPSITNSATFVISPEVRLPYLISFGTVEQWNSLPYLPSFCRRK
jgi:hypothetical protein